VRVGVFLLINLAAMVGGVVAPYTLRAFFNGASGDPTVTARRGLAQVGTGAA